jgi:hypothetical protein
VPVITNAGRKLRFPLVADRGAGRGAGRGRDGQAAERTGTQQVARHVSHGGRAALALRVHERLRLHPAGRATGAGAAAQPGVERDLLHLGLAA